MSGRHGHKRKKKPPPKEPAVSDAAPVAPTANTSESQPQRSDKADMNNLKWIHKPDTTNLAIAGLVLTFIVACIYYFQLDTMQGQLDVIKEQLKLAKRQLDETVTEFGISHRPWVNVSGPTLVTSPLTFDTKGAKVEVQHALKNGGTAVAKQVTVLFILMIGPPPDPGNIQRIARESCEQQFVKGVTDRAGRPLLLPGDVATDQAPTAPTLSRQYFQIVPGAQVTAHLLGCIAYQDEHGQPHGTAFVRRYVTTGGKVLNLTGVNPGTFLDSGYGFAY